MLNNEPLASIADVLRIGNEDALDYYERLEQRVNTVEPEIQSLIAEENRWGRLNREVEELIEKYENPARRPPLFGVPIGVKDIFHVDGMLTRAGSEVPPEVLTGSEAAVVSTLRKKGALILGKTVTTEFAHFEPGPTRNPHDLSRTPGGSSSGSAAAVAAGICPAALGTQTIGSIIRPASFCGIVGFKPSFSRISTDGVIPVSESVDHVGFFTQDTAGASLMASILCQNWQQMPTPVKKPRIGVPDGPYIEQASQVAIDAFEAQLNILSEEGYDILRVSMFDDIEHINKLHKRLVAADAAVNHADWYQDYGDLYAEETKNLVESGKNTTIEEVTESKQSQQRLRSRVSDIMNKNNIDLWVSPAAPGPAPKGIDTTGDPIMNLPWTNMGLPTITIPAQKTDNGLPLGIQCTGRFNADEDVIRWSHQLSEVLPE